MTKKVVQAKLARVRAVTGHEGMNKTEAAWAAVLETQVRAGEIRRWRYEPLKFRLAKATYYTPDFEVVTNDGYLIYYEVKGFWRDDARVKIKTAARLFDDRRWIAVSRKKGQWHFEEFGLP